VVLISEDLDELFQLSDRIQVMYQGRLSAPENAATVDRARIGLMMSGQTFENRGAA
jgi:simple sugar transport system ATP-binding protein